MHDLDPPAGSLLFVENVGNLVCPAMFDLGERAKVVVISVTEGDDKPLKYPHMFRVADLVVVNKTDLLPYVDFDLDRLREQARSLNPDVGVLPLSVRTGENVDAWYALLDDVVDTSLERSPPWSSCRFVRSASASTRCWTSSATVPPPGPWSGSRSSCSAVMSLYGAGLDRIVETLDDDTVRRLADDEVVGNLLVLHDLHPDDVDTRVQRALEQVRPYLGSHAGGVSLSGVDEQGVVHLRLEGSCDGCPSSALTVKSAIEDAILVAAPDVVAVEAEGMVESGPTLLQIEPFSPRAPETAGGTWEHLDLDVPPRTVRAVHVAGETIVVANLDGTLVAYADRCPACLSRALRRAAGRRRPDLRRRPRLRRTAGGARPRRATPLPWRRCPCCPSMGRGRCRCRER